MSIQLTEDQIEAINRGTQSPVSLVDPHTNSLWYLIPASEYQTVQDILEDDRQQTAFRAIGLRNAGRRLSEDE